MLKIALLLIAFVAVNTAMKIKFKRLHFWINKNPKENYLFDAWPLQGDDAGTYGSTNGSEDINVKWKRSFHATMSPQMLPDFYLNYGDAFQQQFTGFDVCQKYNQFSLQDIAQDFFNKIIARLPRDYQCPINDRNKAHAFTNGGTLEWERSKPEAVHCNTPVTMILILIYKVGTTHSSWGGLLKWTEYTEYKIFEAEYKGEFTDCPK